MRHVGYGVMKDGKPAGIWPLPAVECARIMQQYKLKEPAHRYAVVPVYVGGEVTTHPAVMPSPAKTA